MSSRALVGSLAVHALVVGIVIARDPSDDDILDVLAVVTAAASRSDLEVRDPRESVDPRTVTEVTFLDQVVDPAPSVVAAMVRPTTTTTRATTAAAVHETTTAVSGIASTTSPTGTETSGANPKPEGTGKPSRFMAMRGPDLSLPGDVAARVIATSRPLPQAPDESRIVHDGRGVSIPDLQVPASVNEDGTVKFHDKPAVDINWRLHLPSSKELGDALATWYADPYAQTSGRPWQEISKVDQAVEGNNGGGWDSGGTMLDGAPAATLNKKGYSSSGQPQVPIAGGTLDVTSWAMRKFHVGDPYASRKMKLLADTFDARAAIGARHREETLDHSIASMERNVVRVWQAPKLTVAERREALFALWDECADANTAQVTPHEIEAGQRARIIVVSFIRSHFPAGTAIAFTPAEVAAFDAHRSSQQHFAPYGDVANDDE